MVIFPALQLKTTFLIRRHTLNFVNFSVSLIQYNVSNNITDPLFFQHVLVSPASLVTPQSLALTPPRAGAGA